MVDYHKIYKQSAFILVASAVVLLYYYWKEDWKFMDIHDVIKIGCPISMYFSLMSMWVFKP